MGATRNTGYLENLIQYDASDNVAIATSVNPSYKVTLGGPVITTGSITAASAIARGVNMTPTLVAAANNDVLVGLDINPTFTLGAFTGTSSAALVVRNGNVGIGTASLSYPLTRNGMTLKAIGTDGVEFLMSSSTDTGQTGTAFVRTGADFGITNRSNGLINFGTNNTTWLYLTAAATMGIGTSTIGSKLQINGNAAIGYSASTAAPTNGLAVAGNARINNATSQWALSGYSVLEMGAYGILYSSISSGQSFTLANNLYHNGTNWIYKNSTGGSLLAQNGGVLTFETAPSGTAGNIATLTQRITVLLTGDTIFGNGNTSATPALGLIRGTNGSGTNIAGAEFRIQGGQGTGTGDGGAITFYTAAAGTSGSALNSAAERMRITSGGNVGIGSSSPSVKLQVEDSSSTSLNTLYLVNSSTAAVTTKQNNLSFRMTDTVGTRKNAFQLTAYSDSAGGNIENGGLIFSGRKSDLDTEFMRITSGGNVGIGGTTITDSHLLNIQGSTASYNVGIILNKTNATSQIWGITNVGALTFYNYTGAAEAIRVTTDGFFLVGGATSAVGTNYKPPIQVKNLSAAVGNGYGIINASNQQAGGLTLSSSATNGMSLIADPDNLQASTAIDFQIDGTERMRITSGGNVGIGTASPVTYGTRNLDVNAGSGGSAYIVARANNNGGTVELAFDTAAGYLSTKSNHDLIIRTNDVERMRITSGGNVGIGISNPSYLLHIPQNNNLFLGNIYISGSANNPNLGSGATGGSLTLAGGGVGEGKIYIQGAASGGNGYVEFYTNSALRMTIASNGNIGAPSGTNIYNASDLRLKRNISTLSDGLDKILNLNPVKFNWIEGFEPTEEDKDMFGFIAQEVLSVVPEAVESFSNNDIVIGENVIKSPLRVNEKFIIPVLVKAIQELNKKIEVLENR